jgi:hypothetical protein
MVEFKARFPKSSEEKKEYKRIKSEWEKINKEAGNRSYAKRHGSVLSKIIPVALVLIVIASNTTALISHIKFIASSNSGSQTANTLASSSIIPTAASKISFSPSKQATSSISPNSSNYIHKCCEIDKLVSEWKLNVYEDLVAYNTIQFKYYEESTSEIISSIEQLENMSISDSSEIKDFEVYTKNYFSALKEYFVTVIDKSSITSDMYNSLNSWQSQNVIPFDYLEEHLKSTNIEYTIENTDFGKQLHYSISDSSKN